MKNFLTTLFAVLLIGRIASAQEAVLTPAASKTRTTSSSASAPAPSPSASPGTTTAERVTVPSQELDISREAIVPSLGATRYTIGPDRLNSQAQGEHA